MSKFFRPWKIDEAQLLPPSVQDYVPSDHLSRFIVALVRENLDLSELIGSYRSEFGQPPFDPRMMTRFCSRLMRAAHIIAKEAIAHVQVAIIAHD